MSTGNPQAGFGLREAITTLNKAALLDTVMLPGPDGLGSDVPVVAAEAVNSVFVGARLDSRLLLPGELFIALPGENVHGRRFAPDWLARGGWVLTDTIAAADPLLGVSCGAGGGVLCCSDPQAALACLAVAWRERMPARIVGVTGTNGKTTTKDFLAAILAGAGPTHATAGNFNNFLGLPLTLLGLRAEHEFAVIEMGASAVGEIDRLAGWANPIVGLITNASPAHLAEFGSLAEIVQGKGELLDHLPAEGTVVLNADSPGFDTWRDRANCPVVSLGQMTGDHRWSVKSDTTGATLLLDGVSWPVPLPGEHNGFNLAAAILAARALGVADDHLRVGLAAFNGSPHRGVVQDVGGRTVLDDAYNANPGSMLAAVKALMNLPGLATGNRTIAVLGHMAELGPEAGKIHRTTGGQLVATAVDVLLAVGPEARLLGEGFDAAGGVAHYCAAMEEAAVWLATQTRPGDSILVKGSRSAAMERIIPLLAAACAAETGTQD